MKDYKYLIFDGQYYLVRNLKALTPRYSKTIVLKNEEGIPILNENGNQQCYEITSISSFDLVKSFFYSIAKFIRESASCRKIILCFDSAPYHKLKFIENYKGSRSYATYDDLARIDKTKDPLSYLKIEEELKINRIKQDAKSFILENFSKLGICSIIHKGYEADDLAYKIASRLELDDQKSAVVSIDDDWSYLINKNVDWIKSNTKKRFTYDDIVGRSNDFTDDLGISLFQFKSYYDSMYGSHNDLESTVDVTEKIPFNDLLKKYLSGDLSKILDLNKFNAQYESFDIEKYPEYDQVINKIKSLEFSGHISSIDEFELFKLVNNFNIKTDYYSNFIKELDSTLYD